MGKKEELEKLKKEMEVDKSLAGWKFTRGRLKYSVDEKFFDVWAPQMAYVLGFTFADGNIYKTTLSWDLQKRDLELLKKIRKAFSCTYPITFHRNSSCRIKISNQLLIKSAISRGLLPKKNMRKTLPQIPQDLLCHFVRGYLDGDGWIVVRKNRNEVDMGFSSGNKEFLERLNNIIFKILGISGTVRKKIKITPKKVQSTTFQIEFYASKGFKVADWLYNNLSVDDLFLQRKYRKYLEAKELYDFLSSGTRKVREIQKKLDRSMKEVLHELHKEKGYDGIQIANILGVHSSSIYRWLARFDIKYPERRSLKNG